MNARALGLAVGLCMGPLAALVWSCSSDSSPAQPAPTQDGGADTSVQVVDSGPDVDLGVLSCAAYCVKIMTNCSGPNLQYADQTECERICARLPLGTQGEQSGNSVACRQYHAGNTPADVHCPHAGPTGGGVCGTRCEAFCAIDLATCLGDGGLGEGGVGFATAQDCQTACATWSATDTSTPSGPTTGDTLACREYHLRAANGTGPTSAATHCPHAATLRDAGADSSFPCK